MKYSVKFLYIIALVIIAGSGISLLNNYSQITPPIAIRSSTFITETTVPKMNSTAIASASPSQSVSETLYTNTAYGYEFTYPAAIRLGDRLDPRIPVTPLTKGICATQPGSGFCSFGVTLITANGPATLTSSYIESIYPQFNAEYDIISTATLNGLSGILVVNGGLHDMYVETSPGVVLEFSDGQDAYAARIIPTLTFTR
jgi:hypothetical protein